MKLSFESNLAYQQDAINSIVDLFEGQPKDNEALTFTLQSDNIDNSSVDIVAVSNNLLITKEQILTNLKSIQEQNNLPITEQLDSLSFSVEMETGTGKTYVYLRTIYELNKKYGFTKFVIVVPSIAIREGVLKNLEITHKHFQNLYDKVPLNYQVYDRSKISCLRPFATNNNIEVLVINIDAFAKDENVINKSNDRLTGYKPIQFIQATNPIIIVDEPQNMETEPRQKALNSLNPLSMLRYSATHKNKSNLTYSLNPVRAYELGLVKQIEVNSIMEEESFNQAFIRVDSVTNSSKTKVISTVTIHSNEITGVTPKTIKVSVGDDLYKLSNQREIYKDGYVINEIDVSNQCITLSNGDILYTGSSQGSLSEDILKFQIRTTIEEHLKKEKLLNKRGIKVLSLFFIDRVANYRGYSEDGNAVLGKFAIWFEEIYQELITNPIFQELNKFAINDIHNGYFSQDNKKRFKDTKGETLGDNDTYSLIMKEKEKLLSLENPLRFIFSHSALREGWDNPNVFQICTLNETKSEIKKRQEIGRGLRLCVDQSGKRLYDNNINRLTVIANESYEDFAKALQNEIEAECGIKFPKIKNVKDRIQITYKKGFELDPQFLEIWNKIKYKTKYSVNYDTDKLITICAKRLKDLPAITAPLLIKRKATLNYIKTGVDATYRGGSTSNVTNGQWAIPDVLGYIQGKTELTRDTIYHIIKQSGKMNDIIINPQLFLDVASQVIKTTLHDMMIDGIKYQKINGRDYEMALFNSQELEPYINNWLFTVQDKQKTIYDNYIPLDSKTENQFAKDCDTSENVKFYFKLPTWFKIPTPIGSYNPDWAIIFENDSRIYFIIETKNTGTDNIDLDKLSKSEQIKIKCGAAHFKQLESVEFRVESSLQKLV